MKENFNITEKTENKRKEELKVKYVGLIGSIGHITKQPHKIYISKD